jgi:hypothetical protein
MTLADINQVSQYEFVIVLNFFFFTEIETCFSVDNLQVRLSFSRHGAALHMPPPYSIVIQVR